MGFGVAESLWEVMGGGEHISTGEIFTQRVAILRHVLVHSDIARVVHMVIFGFFFLVGKPVMKVKFHLSWMQLLSDASCSDPFLH